MTEALSLPRCVRLQPSLADASTWLHFVQSTARAYEPDCHYTTLCDEEAEALRPHIRAQLECEAR